MRADWGRLTKSYIIWEGADIKMKIWLGGGRRLAEAGYPTGALVESGWGRKMCLVDEQWLYS